MGIHYCAVTVDDKKKGIDLRKSYLDFLETLYRFQQLDELDKEIERMQEEESYAV